MTLYINTKDPREVRVALKKEEKVVVEQSEENEYGSQVLLPLIEKILKNQGKNFENLTGVETETGPGSFTGLRVGAAVAQALGFVLNIPVNGKVGKPVELRYT